MNELYVEVVLNTPADDTLREILSFQLYELGFNGFLENEIGLLCYIPKTTLDRYAAKQTPHAPGRKTAFPHCNFQHRRNSEPELEPPMGRVDSTR